MRDHENVRSKLVKKKLTRSEGGIHHSTEQHKRLSLFMSQQLMQFHPPSEFFSLYSLFGKGHYWH